MARAPDIARRLEPRVVVRLGEGSPSSPAVIHAAVHVARAFAWGVEGLFIEDPAVFAAVAHAGAAEISLAGGRRRTLSVAQVNHDVGHFGVAMQRQVSEAALDGGVPFAARVVRDSVMSALTTACSGGGMGSIIALAEPMTSTGNALLLNDISGMTCGAMGVLSAGRAAAWRRGPIVIAIETIETMIGLTHLGQRLALPSGDPVWLLPVGEDEIALDWLDSEIRLTLADTPGLRLLRPVARHGMAQALWAAAAACRPRMIVARAGGLMVAPHEAEQALARLAVPVLLAVER
jgi:hypothetical protein